MRTAPRKLFQPSAMGGEWRRARSSGWRGRGARRAWTRATMAASASVVVFGGLGTYGSLILLIVVAENGLCCCKAAIELLKLAFKCGVFWRWIRYRKAYRDTAVLVVGINILPYTECIVLKLLRIALDLVLQ